MPSPLWVAYLLRLTVGVLAIEAPSKPVGPQRAASYAAAAAEAARTSGEDPFELLAIARNESDFIEDSVGPDGKDCGITQTRITVTHYRCGQLRHDYQLAFREAARELSEYRHSCLGRSDFDRCRLNRYNSGYRYSTKGVHGRYWLRVKCFAEAARAGVIAGDTCRKVKSNAAIEAMLARGRGSMLAAR